MRLGAGSRDITLIAFMGILLLAFYVRLPGFHLDTKYRDVYYTWLEGKRIAAGVNPYERFRHADMVTNEKFPTLLPFVYLLSAATIKIGLSEFNTWLIFWRIVELCFDFALGAFIYLYGCRMRRRWVGLLGMFLWFFARWSLYVWEIGNTESIVLLLMVLSLYTWDKRPVTSGLLFGAALGFKHFGILLLPILLVRSRDYREALMRLGYILIIPVATSLPFFIWDPTGFAKAMLFNVVRGGASHLLEDSVSIRILFGSAGFLSRFFLFVVYVLFWSAAIRRKWSLWLCAAMAFFLFVSFNPVLFTQYFSWMLPFIALYLVEVSAADDAHLAKKAV